VCTAQVVVTLPIFGNRAGLAILKCYSRRKSEVLDSQPGAMSTSTLVERTGALYIAETQICDGDIVQSLVVNISSYPPGNESVIDQQPAASATQ